MEEPSYHERQRLQQCLRHTVNNLLQRAAFSSVDLNAIAAQLAPGPLFLNPHRTLFFGNYDVNVLDRVLQQLGLELHWCDLRDTTFELVDLDSCVGIVLNVKVQAGKMMSWMGGGRHWLVLRPFGKRWWNLDSLLLAPELVTAAAAAAGSGTAPLEPAEPTEATAGSAAAVRQFLALQLASRDAKVFRVAAAAAAAAADTLASHPLVDATAPGIPEDAPS